jgi:hypothetical protein
MKNKRILAALALTIAAGLLSGCIVTSVYPYYTEKDVVFDPALAGGWVKVGEANEHWSFAPEGTNGYQLTYVSGNQTNLMKVHLFKLGGERFLDLFSAESPGDVMPPPIPSHLLFRVTQMTPNLGWAPINHEWLKEAVQKNPATIRHHLIRSGEKPEDVQVVLTADTEELQRFVVRHLATKEAWEGGFELKREGAPAVVEPK